MPAQTVPEGTIRGQTAPDGTILGCNTTLGAAFVWAVGACPDSTRGYHPILSGDRTLNPTRGLSAAILLGYACGIKSR